MSEWKEKKFEDICIVDKECLPENTDPAYRFAYISLSDVEKGKVLNTVQNIAFADAPSRARRILHDFDVLMATVRPNLQAFVILSADVKDMIGSTGFAVLSKKDNNSTEYIYQYLFTEHATRQINNLVAGSNYPAISSSAVRQLAINIPTSLAEQRKIARILSTVDAVIEKTEAAIAKYKAIKDGMMRDLFTRGIDLKTGKLRPRYEDAPKLYKESELGWVPKEWEIFILGLKGHFQNGVNKEKEAFGKGTLFANIIDAYPEILNCKTLGRVLITPSELDNYQLHKGDILFVRSSVKPEGVAYNTMFITCIEKVVFCGFMIRYRFENKIENIPSFYNFYFRSDDFRKTAIASSTVSANTNINQPALSRLSAVQPNQKEQKLIIEKITCISDLIDKEQLHLIKYKNIKSGLMSDLLTGKVRVKYNENEKVEVV